MEKSYEDFEKAYYKLYYAEKIKSGLSFSKIAKKTDIIETTVTALASRRRKDPPSYEQMEKIAGVFNLEPEYFYDYRWKKVMDYLDKNRKFLDVVERVMKKYKKEFGNNKENPKTVAEEEYKNYFEESDTEKETSEPEDDDNPSKPVTIDR